VIGLGSGLINKKLKRLKMRDAILLMLPALTVLILTVAYPLFWGLNLSVQEINLLRPNQEPTFVGAQNYIEVFGSAKFRKALFQTLGFVVTTITLELIIGLAISSVLNRESKGVKFFRTMVALPLMIAPVVAGLQWRWLYADQYGLINYLLSLVGIKGPLWLASTWGARAAILIANLWLALPFVILVLLAGLQSIPAEIFEASVVDGARGYQVFRYITLPLLRPSILVILVIRLVDAVRIFDVVYVLTQGGPGDATEVLSSFIYKEAFKYLHFPEGAAAAFIMVGLMAIMSWVSIKLLRAD